MKNSDYWKKRFQELEKRRYQSSADMINHLEQVWSRASRAIQNDIEKWLNRIAANNEISYQAARKLLDDDLLDEFHWTVEEYIRKGKENALNEKWIKQLENASARVHISRLEAMKVQLQQELEVLYAEYNGSVDEYLKNVYQDDYYRTAFEVAKGTSVGVDLHKISTSDIEQVLKKPWLSDGKEFSSRIWDNKEKLVNLLDRELTQQIIRGTDPQKAINTIASKMNVSKSQAGTLVMTEAAAASSAARKQVFEDLDVERYEIVATLDLRTSEICRDMDGKVFKMSEYRPGETAPPFHPRCRTTTVPWFEDFQDGGKRAARNPVTGKTEYVPENMTYKEWYRTYVEGKTTASSKKSVAKGRGSGIINSPDTEEGASMMEIRSLGRIDTNILTKEFGKIQTDEIIVTNERLSHIKVRHPEDYELFERFGSESVTSPDLIIKDNKNEGTVFMIKRLPDTNLNVVVRVVLETDNSKLKNSVMTFYRIRERNLKKLIEKNGLLYKKE